MQSTRGKIGRRGFMGTALAGAALADSAWAADEAPLPRPAETRKGGLVYRALGKTGESVSILGVGGSHIGQTSFDESGIRIVRTAIDRGVNFKMGKALRDGYRQKVFLMTKVDGRTKEAAAKQID